MATPDVQRGGACPHKRTKLSHDIDAPLAEHEAQPLVQAERLDFETKLMRALADATRHVQIPEPLDLCHIPWDPFFAQSSVDQAVPWVSDFQYRLKQVTDGQQRTCRCPRARATHLHFSTTTKKQVLVSPAKDIHALARTCFFLFDHSKIQCVRFWDTRP